MNTKAAKEAKSKGRPDTKNSCLVLDGVDGWHKGDVAVDFSVDPRVQAIATTFYTVNGATNQATHVEFHQEGSTTITYWSVFQTAAGDVYNALPPVPCIWEGFGGTSH